MDGADEGIEPVSSGRGPRGPSGMQADSGSASAPNARPPAKPRFILTGNAMNVLPVPKGYQARRGFPHP
ncbi:hypothetical protein GCM10022626_16930 [[Pseudomonas] carboxydohydrogena]